MGGSEGTPVGGNMHSVLASNGNRASARRGQLLIADEQTARSSAREDARDRSVGLWGKRIRNYMTNLSLDERRPFFRPKTGNGGPIAGRDWQTGRRSHGARSGELSGGNRACWLQETYAKGWRKSPRVCLALILNDWARDLQVLGSPSRTTTGSETSLLSAGRGNGCRPPHQFSRR